MIYGFIWKVSESELQNDFDGDSDRDQNDQGVTLHTLLVLTLDHLWLWFVLSSVLKTFDHFLDLQLVCSSYFLFHIFEFYFQIFGSHKSRFSSICFFFFIFLSSFNFIPFTFFEQKCVWYKVLKYLCFPFLFYTGYKVKVNVKLSSVSIVSLWKEVSKQ